MLLEARNLTKVFQTSAGPVRAVDGVSFALARGQTLGLMGESGSGKSTVARLVLRLHEPTAGEVRFDGADLLAACGKALRAFRRRMQMVFQDPYSSLLPHYTAGDNVAEPLRLHGMGDRRGRREEARRLLEQVGVGAGAADRYPHEFSGGQQQRVAIARALALRPDLLVCDEPTSSLDVSIQAQILTLLQRLQEELGLSCLFISHNLAVVKHLATHIAVMRRGRLVELTPKAELFRHPVHPYTQALLAAVLPVRASVRAPARTADAGLAAPAGHPDGNDEPALREVAPGHYVAGVTV